MKRLFIGLALVVGCTRPNPEVCCGDAADCNAAGIPEGRTCAGDLVCVDHSCGEAPPPECIDSSECTTATEFVCDPVMHTCRGCITDEECDSGACGSDALCIAASEVLYVSATAPGPNTACTRAAPCQLVAAMAGANATRFTYVLETGAYSTTATIAFDLPQQPLAPRAEIHGHQSRITASGGGAAFAVVRFNQVSVGIRDLQIVGRTGDTALEVTFADLFVTRAFVSGMVGIQFNGGAHLDVDRTVVLGNSGISIGPASQPAFEFENLMIYGASNYGISALGSGTISNVTVASNGASTARGIIGAADTMLRNSIVWAPGATQPPISGCILDNVIAGPFPVFGARATDPGFEALSGQNFHLSATSVARDAADDGPPLDFEGDPRPQGVRFDLGADEASP